MPPQDRRPGAARRRARRAQRPGLDRLEPRSLLATASVTLLSQNFDAVPLGPSVDEEPPSPSWTPTPPAGWTVDNAAMPIGGVAEWTGWTFPEKAFWATVAGDQGRSGFTRGQGIVAVADPDEWDDKSHDPGTFNSFLTTPGIAVAGSAGGQVTLTFDSSWLPEAPQKANLRASFDGGAPVTLFTWQSDPSQPDFKGDATDEAVSVPIDVPAGATNLTLSFGVYEAGNNWWWAVDNLRVRDAADVQLFAEDFEGLRPSLIAPVDEFTPAFTAQAPAGWAIDDSAMPAGGVTEWSGWSLARKDFWTRVNGGAGSPRDQFARGTNVVAVADPGAWNKRANAPGAFQTLFVSPAIPVDLINKDTARLLFDSSWAPSGDLTAVVTVAYDRGAPVEVLRWGSDPNRPEYKPEAANEAVSLDLHNPLGALSAVVRVSVSGSNPDPGAYWWAIDNVQVVGLGGVVSLLTENFDTPASPSAVVNEPNPFVDVWTGFEPTGWTADNSGVPLGTGVIDWAGWAFVRPEWWASISSDDARTSFRGGRGVIAVVDPNRWNGSGSFDASLTTPNIAVGGAGGSVALTFNSSWLAAASQELVVTATYNTGATATVLRWTADGFSTRKATALDEAVSVPVDLPAGVTGVRFTFEFLDGVGGGFWAFDDLRVLSSGGATLFQQDFEELAPTLTPPIAETNPLAQPWSAAAPPGWSIAETLPSGGVTEWRGWSVANRYFWAAVGGDGGREAFDRARNFVAVVDADSWGDLGVGAGAYSALLRTPTISLDGVIAGTAFLRFDSSWVPGTGQAAVVRVRYDGGAPIELLRWSSDPASPNYTPANPDRTISLVLNNPLGARGAVVEFGVEGADGNSRYWAIDNVRVLAQALQATLLSENFDSIPLGPSPTERGALPVYTHTPPAGWSVDAAGVPTGGIREWAGWSFVDKVFWTSVAQTGGAANFTKGRGIVAVADSDEFDDSTPRPDYSATGGVYATFFTTAPIALNGATTATLKFDSSWRAEDSQRATIVARYSTPGGAVERQVLLWESVAGANFKADAVNETVEIALTDIPAGATDVRFVFGYDQSRNNWWWAVDNLSLTNGATTLWSEDFETLRIDTAPTDETFSRFWRPDPPAGWTEDNSGVPTGGVTEWAGWSYTWAPFWWTVAQSGGQGFTKGKGIIAVADSDEFADIANGGGSYGTFFTTAPIALNGPTSPTLRFDSSWRPEDNQRATIVARYSTPGGVVERQVLLWESVAGANFKADAVNETVEIALTDIPADATEVRFVFGYDQASNNWWWAVDNIAVLDGSTTLFEETFDSLGGLQAPVNEIDPYAAAAPYKRVWSKTGPEGWTVDDSQFQDGGPDEPKGVLDWRGWSFAYGPNAPVPFWGVATDDQDRQQFTKSRNVVAVVDPDEYDDAAHGGGANWLYNSFLNTRPIDVAGVGAGSAFLTFDSSWRPEGFDDGDRTNNQTATITVSFDGGAPIEILRWDSNPSGSFFHPDSTNETVRIPLNNPTGARTMVLSFGMTRARNDWWWAIDNLSVTGVIDAFQVAASAATPSGVAIDFTRAVDASALNLYGATPADLTVVDGSGAPVAGSLVVSPDGSRVTFVKTGGPLADGTYTLTLRAAADAFKDGSGALLDGDGDGVAGGDFVQVFTVAGRGPAVALADALRGAGQDVNIPATDAGLPLTISEGLGVDSVEVVVEYDPALLTVTGATLGSGLPAGASVALTVLGAGRARILFTSPTSLPAGPATLARLVGTVPASAPYGEKQVLRLTDLKVNGSAAIGRVDSGLHVAAFPGDASGDGQYTGGDDILMRRYVLGLNSSFALFRNLDPVLLADVNGDGTATVGDALQVRRAALGLAAPLLPPLPVAPPTIPPEQDPVIWLPTNLVARPGATFQAPLRFLQTDRSEFLLRSFDVVVGIDAGQLGVAGVSAGGLIPGFEVAYRFDAERGLLFISGVSPDESGVVLRPRALGDLVVLTLRASETARGALPLNLRATGFGGIGTIRTLFNGGRLYLNPAPTDGSDPVDGLVRISSRGVRSLDGPAPAAGSADALPAPGAAGGPIGRALASLDAALADGLVPTATAPAVRSALQLLRGGAADIVPLVLGEPASPLVVPVNANRRRPNPAGPR